VRLSDEPTADDAMTSGQTNMWRGSILLPLLCLGIWFVGSAPGDAVAVSSDGCCDPATAAMSTASDGASANAETCPTCECVETACQTCFLEEAPRVERRIVPESRRIEAPSVSPAVRVALRANPPRAPSQVGVQTHDSRRHTPQTPLYLHHQRLLI
jgi:hypothetical protein